MSCACRKGFGELFAVQVVDILVFFADEPGDRLHDQCAPGHAQQRRSGQVGLQNQSLFGDDAISHRCQVIEVEIAPSFGGQFLLRRAQLFVLDLKFNLVHAQLVEHSTGFFRRQGLDVFRRLRHFPPGDLFGPTSQFGVVFGEDILVFHYELPLFYGCLSDATQSCGLFSILK